MSGSLAAHGITMELPSGWEGRIRRRETIPAQHRLTIASTPSSPPAVAHAASFVLPTGVGDFGGGAVERMLAGDLFVALVEYDRDSVGTALFKRQGVPRRLATGQFSRQALQRTLPGQGGTQVFFEAAGRAFCLYVVLGSYAWRARSLPVVNGLLAAVTIR